MGDMAEVVEQLNFKIRYMQKVVDLDVDNLRLMTLQAYRLQTQNMYLLSTG